MGPVIKGIHLISLLYLRIGLIPLNYVWDDGTDLLAFLNDRIEGLIYIVFGQRL